LSSDLKPGDVIYFSDYTEEEIHSNLGYGPKNPLLILETAHAYNHTNYRVLFPDGHIQWTSLAKPEYWKTLI